MLQINLLNLACKIAFDTLDRDLMCNIELGLLLQDLGLIGSVLFIRFLDIAPTLLVHDGNGLVMLSLFLSNQDLVLARLHVDLVVDFGSVQSGLTAHVFAELCLKIFEKRHGADLNASDLASLDPDAPALNNLEHFFVDGVAKDIAVGHHLVNAGICDDTTNDSTSLGNEGVVRALRVARADIAKILVGIEGARAITVDGPDNHASDFYTLHLLRDLLGFKGSLVDSGRELCHLVEGSTEAAKADSSAYHLTIVHQEDPLVRLTLDPESLDVATSMSDGHLQGHNDSDWDHHAVNESFNDCCIAHLNSLV